jgi:hypothetical protein
MELLLGDKDADARKVRIHDIRDKEEDYSLERKGFQALKHDFQKEIFKDEETIKSLHYPAMAELPREWFVLQNGPLLTPMRG